MWKLKLYRGKFAAVRRFKGTTQRYSLRTADERLAEQRFDDFKKLQAAPNETLEEIFELYKSEKSKAEQEKLSYMWKNLKPEFANYRPDQVDREKAISYTNKRRKQGIKDGTIIRELGCIRASLRRFDKSFPKTWFTPPAPDPKDINITREEFSRLLDNAAAPHIKLFIMLAIATGARKTAVLELEWHQVDFERRFISLGRGSRIKRRATVPLNDMVYQALKEAYLARTCDYVIEYNSDKVKDVRTGFNRTVERSGLSKKITPHVLRHSAAIWMAEGGIPMSEIAQYLGHSDTKVTERTYARYSPDYLRKASDLLQLNPANTPYNEVKNG